MKPTQSEFGRGVKETVSLLASHTETPGSDPCHLKVLLAENLDKGCCLAKCSTFKNLECTLVNQAGPQNLHVHQRTTTEQGKVGILFWFRLCECSHCVPAELGEGGMASAFACLSVEMCSECWILFDSLSDLPTKQLGLRAYSLINTLYYKVSLIKGGVRFTST